MKTKSFQTAEYISWILEKYQEIHKELHAREAYRISEIKRDNESGTHSVKVVIVGTGKIVDFTPEEIVADDRMIESFSKKDVRIITYLACSNNKLAKYKITSQHFCEKLRKFVFCIRKRKSSDVLQKSASEISKDKTIIANLDAEDAYRVGYAYGNESVLAEGKQKIILLKRQKTGNLKSSNKEV